jgi:(p)ppGpp synthase/HD superfamily hydrolase
MEQRSVVQDSKKREIALRYFLLGKGYNKALRAMAFNQKLFQGTRKDGVTPEFDHHVCQVQYSRTLLGLMFPEETACTIFFHDTPEDKGLAIEEIRRLYSDCPDFGGRVADATWRMTKIFRGEKRREDSLFEEMAKCPIASIAKGCDRIHNVQSMIGVFSAEKQRSYLEEVDRLFLPMLKEAERNFPEQEAAYKNIRTILKSQSAIIRGTLAAAEVVV